MKKYIFEHCIRVRYHETDQQGVVYHSRYLEYADIAMTEFFRDLGWNYIELVNSGCDPSLVKTTVEFMQPAMFEDNIKVSVYPVRVGSSSFTLRFSINKQSNVITIIETIYVNIDAKTNSSRPLPASVKERLLEAMVNTKEDLENALAE